jgi:beta propeller repeat protein
MGLVLFLIFISSAVSAAPLRFTETRITTNGSDQIYPDIYGNRIVWQDERNGNWDIYVATTRPRLVIPRV